VRLAAAFIVALSLAGGVSRSSAADVAESVECDAPGKWTATTTGAWVKRMVEVAGYPVEACTETAWVAATPTTRFAIWADEPWKRPAGMRAASEPYLRGALTDGRRVVWRAQGLAVFVEAAVLGIPLPGATAFGWLRTSSRGLPRTYRRLELMPMPPAALRACRSDPVLASACPARIPRVTIRLGPAGWRTYPAARPVDGIFGLQLGGEIPGRPELMRPPRILHVEVEAASRRLRGTPFAWPAGAVTAPRDGLAREDRSSALLLAHVTWGGRSGTVVLAPPYPSGGSQGNHVLFRWRRGGTTYVVGVHAWEPFREAFATLRRIVQSLPR
jgi:hypothetical protein